MQIFSACHEIFHQLDSLLGQIQLKDFSRPSGLLNNATIGQHVRHTLEFFLCLEKGFTTGVINYDKRTRDIRIETDKAFAASSISHIRQFVASNPNDKVLELEVGYEQQSDKCFAVQTSYYRELAYNIEHAVHHMAMMKIGVREIAPYVILPNEFGVAVSTVRYQNISAKFKRTTLV